MQNKSIGLYLIASMVIWGAVIIGCALKLKGTNCFHSISSLLAAGAIFHWLFIWGSLSARFGIKTNKESSSTNSSIDP